MKGLVKVFIAVDVAMAATVGGMKLYLDSGTGAAKEAVTASPEGPIAPVDSGTALTSGQIWLLVAAAVTIVACIAVWIALGRYEQRRANANLDLANAPLPELAPVAESAVTPETGNLFRVAIPAGDRPVFGRAARRPETA